MQDREGYNRLNMPPPFRCFCVCVVKQVLELLSLCLIRQEEEEEEEEEEEPPKLQSNGRQNAQLFFSFPFVSSSLFFSFFTTTPCPYPVSLSTTRYA
jgi:hypothetical protein